MTAATTWLLVCVLWGCEPGHGGVGWNDGGPVADGKGVDGGAMEPGVCPAGGEGLACLFALWDTVGAACEAEAVAAFVASLERRRGALPAWYEGRALFVSWGRSVAVAGEMNGWQPSAATAPVCGTDVFGVELAVPSGRWPYKVVADGAWVLDGENAAFVFDDFVGNVDGRNSVLNTYDSGVGTLVRAPQELCSEALEGCRAMTAYLPPGYGAPENATRNYPVLFLHDGQNVWDDTDCCFGHTGWEVNVAMDREVAAGRVEPAIVVGVDHGGVQRVAEYITDRRDAFMDFQVNTAQPRAAALWRIDEDRVFVGGSSAGGHISLLLASGYPDVYAGAASLSGAFWVQDGEPEDIFNVLPQKGKVPVALYLDHGGTAVDGGDGYYPNLRMRDLLVSMGWSLSCERTDDSLCYHHAVGALHDELAWRDRAPLFLRFFFGL